VRSQALFILVDDCSATYYYSDLSLWQLANSGKPQAKDFWE